MLKTKNVLMLVLMSAGLLAVLTGTAVSQTQPAFADDEDECEDNGDFSCNEETQKTVLENDCKIVNKLENDDRSDENSNGNIDNAKIICSNALNLGGNGIVDEDPFDLTPEECNECFDPLSDAQLQQLAVVLNDLFDIEFPDNPTRVQILDIICEALDQGLPLGLVPGDVGEALEQVDTVSEAVLDAIVACLRGELP